VVHDQIPLSELKMIDRRDFRVHLTSVPVGLADSMLNFAPMIAARLCMMRKPRPSVLGDDVGMPTPSSRTGRIKLASATFRLMSIFRA
jgi:hypothetical protein